MVVNEPARQTNRLRRQAWFTSSDCSTPSILLPFCGIAVLPLGQRSTGTAAGLSDTSAMATDSRCSEPVSGIGRYSDQYHSQVLTCGGAGSAGFGKAGLVQQAVVAGQSGGLDPVGHPELVQQRGDHSLRGALRDEHPGGDVGGLQAPGDQ